MCIRDSSPSDEHPSPEVSVGVSVLCADTEDEAQQMLQSLERWRSDGLRGPIPKTTPEENSSHKLRLRDSSRPMVIGTPDQVRQGLEGIAHEYACDELLLVSICHDHSKRLKSYRLIAEAFQD